VKRRILKSFIALLCVFCLAACGNSSKDSKGDKAGNTGRQTNSSKTDNGNKGSSGNAGAKAGSNFESIPAGFIMWSISGSNVTISFDGSKISADFSGDFDIDLIGGDWSLKCLKNDTTYEQTFALFKSGEVDGKRRSSLVKQVDWKVVDGKLVITFDTSDIEGFDFFEEGRQKTVRVAKNSEDTNAQTWQYAKEDVVSADGEIGNLFNDYGIGYKASTWDQQYFTPATDDYIITNYDSYDYEGNPTQTNALFSFDENGNCVQYVARIEVPVDKEISGDADKIAGENGYYRDYSNLAKYLNDATFGAKFSVINSLTKNTEVYLGGYYVESDIESGAKIKVSKPITEGVQVKVKIPSREDVKFDIVSSYVGELGIGDDYCVGYGTADTMDELIENRTYMEGGKMIMNGPEPVTQDYRWPRVALERINLWEFDESGKEIKNVSFVVFEEGSMIPYYLYRFGVLNYSWEHPENGPLRYPEYRSDSPIDVVIHDDFMDYLSDEYTLLGDNILCHVVKDPSFGTNKADLLTSFGNPTFWYSKPGLSKKQVEDLGITWEEKTYSY